jgi:hypothetical protein
VAIERSPYSVYPVFRYAERRSEIETRRGLNIWAGIIVKRILSHWALIDRKVLEAFSWRPTSAADYFTGDCASSIQGLRGV